MKEFFVKHPIITFLIADLVIGSTLRFGNNILKVIAASKGITMVDEIKVEEETKNDEPADDHQ